MSRRDQERQRISVIRLLPIHLDGPGFEDVHATALDATPCGMAVLTDEPFDAPFTIGWRVLLRLTVDGEDYQVEATIQNKTRIGDRDRLGFKVTNWGPLADVLLTDRRLPELDRRRAERLYFQADELFQGRIVDERNGEVFEGTFHDVSATGACVELNGFYDAFLEEDESVRIEFALPGFGDSLQLAVSLRRQHGDLFAFEFDRTEPAYEAYQERFEAFRAQRQGDSQSEERAA